MTSWEAPRGVAAGSDATAAAAALGQGIPNKALNGAREQTSKAAFLRSCDSV